MYRENPLIRNCGLTILLFSLILCCLSACDSPSKRGSQQAADAETQKVHALLIILGDDPDIQKSVEKNQGLITTLLREVSRSSEVHLTVMKSEPGFTGEITERVLFNTADVTPMKSSGNLGIIKPHQVKDWVRTVKTETRPADTLLVYYSGHGVMPDEHSNIHDLVFDSHGDAHLPRGWLAEELWSMPARLKMLITDTCSERVGAAGPSSRQVDMYVDVRAKAQFYTKNLFLEHSGNLDITAASPGQRAYGLGTIGGHFTHSLAESLVPKSDTNKDGFLSWAELFAAARAKTEALYNEASTTFSPSLQQQIKKKGQTPVASALPTPTSDRYQPADAVDVPLEGPPPAVALLTFTSVPSGAEILIDGFTVGQTPLTDYELETDGASTKDIEVTVKAEGYDDAVKKFRMKKGEPFSWEFKLTKERPTTDAVDAPLAGPPPAVAILNFTSVPSGATVFIDRFTVGQTPLTDYELETEGRSEREIEVTVQAEGYEAAVEKFRVQRGKLFNWEFKLTKEKPKTPQTGEMVLIPAGEFEMGSNDPDAWDDQQPVHTVYLDAFYIDKYEVTVGQYKQFMRATGHRAVPDWISKYFPTDRHPVVGVSWHDAMAYAKWAGKRLPTEAEWEYAARGGLIGKEYPWGDSIDPSKANYGRNVGDTTAVGKYLPNGYGLYDMAGNVDEWCLDEYDANFYHNSRRRNPIAGASSVDWVINNFTNVTTYRVLRGGSWTSTPVGLRVALRSRDDPTDTGSNDGFRCARAQ